MGTRSTGRWLLACGLVVFAGTVFSTQAQVPQPFIAVQPDELRPGEGTTQVVIMGDPSGPGMYIVQNTFAPGRMSSPHFHDKDRYITVVSGTCWVFLGPDADTVDPSEMIPMHSGSFVFHPAFGHHYDGAKDEEAFVRIMGMGPVITARLEQPATR